eukprot:496648-Rhodomonas_salina.3
MNRGRRSSRQGIADACSGCRDLGGEEGARVELDRGEREACCPELDGRGVAAIGDAPVCCAMGPSRGEEEQTLGLDGEAGMETRGGRSGRLSGVEGEREGGGRRMEKVTEERNAEGKGKAGAPRQSLRGAKQDAVSVVGHRLVLDNHNLRPMPSAPSISPHPSPSAPLTSLHARTPFRPAVPSSLRRLFPA